MPEFIQILAKNKFWFGFFFLTLVVGALAVLPAFLIWQNLLESGNTFLLMQQNVYQDEFFQYVPRAREVFDGHFPPTGVYSDEAGPSPLNPVPPFLFSLFLRLFDGGVNEAYLTAQFFFTSLIFLLFFTLGWLVFNSRAAAVFSALVGTLTQIPQLLFRYYDRDYLAILFKKFLPIVRTPLDKMYFARMDDPMLTIPFLLVALITLYLFWIKPRILTAVLAGLFSGLLAYVYLHYWLFITMFVLVLTLVILSLKDYRFRRGKFFIFGCTYFLVLVPYVINYLDFNSAAAADYTFRLGKEINRFLVWEYLKSPSGFAIVINQFIYLTLLALVYFFYLRTSDGYRKNKGIFFLGLILTMFLVWHIPILTGFGFALAHFNKPINLAVFIMLFDLGFNLVRRIKLNLPAWGKVMVTLVILASASLVAKHIVNAGVFLQPPPDRLRSYSFPQELAFSWQWLNNNIAGEPRIVSNSLVTSLYLTSYTSSRPYLATGFISTLSDIELENRFYVSNKLFDVPGEVLNQRFRGPPLYNCETLICFKDTWLNVDFGKTRWYLTSANWSRTAFENKPQKTLQKYEDMSVVWSKTNAEFVYYGPWEKQFSRSNLTADPLLKLVYANPTVEIYQVVK